MRTGIQCVIFVVLFISICMVYSGQTYFKREQHLHKQTSQQKRLSKQAGLSFPSQNNQSYNFNKKSNKNQKNQISSEQKQFNHQFVQEKKGKIMQLLKTHKPEFDTIQNCQIYNTEDSCALCKSSFVLVQDSTKCVNGQIKHCIEYLSETSCGKCQNGYVLSEMLQKCRAYNDYFDDGYDLEEDEDDQIEEQQQGSGINWNRPNLVPDSNEIPDGEYDIFEDLFDEYIINGTDIDGELEQIIQNMQSDGEQEQQQQQQQQHKQNTLGSLSDGEQEKTNIELLQEEILKQNKVNAFMSLFDNKY